MARERFCLVSAIFNNANRKWKSNGGTCAKIAANRGTVLPTFLMVSGWEVWLMAGDCKTGHEKRGRCSWLLLKRRGEGKLSKSRRTEGGYLTSEGLSFRGRLGLSDILR